MKTSLPRVDWPRFGRDLAVIILGVLIALGFDNVASARADRRLERQYLLRLSRDLRADSLMLANFRRTAGTGEQAALRLLSVLGGNEDSATDTLVARSFSDATRGAYLSPNSPTIEELKSTGNLRVLRDDELRDAILNYYADIAWFQRSLQTVMQRGKDPLGELGWDIQAFDPAIIYAANMGMSAAGPGQPAFKAKPLGDLTTRYRNHPDAQRVTRRALTYNAMLQPIVGDWQTALDKLRDQLPE